MIAKKYNKRENKINYLKFKPEFDFYDKKWLKLFLELISQPKRCFALVLSHLLRKFKQFSEKRNVIMF